ncbi:MAG: ABC transporter ATP-binding protein [Rhizobiales bacterium]|nr:ABC transporter ATP-binding protein [Hyphomicrobiales bacterium]
MPIIELKNLVKRYGSFKVLHGINLKMVENEFTVFVGPSGCGKSTTLRMIAGLETVTAGDITINGNSIINLEPKSRDLAMVFQDYALYPHMNVAKNMSFALRLQRAPKAEIKQKVEAVAETLGLTDFLHRKPGELSGGQRQRVAIGRALIRDSGTFLFDEPLSNLDAKLRGKMRAELALMHQRVNKNMIYVTHDQIEAMTLADRIVVMHGGHIQQHGSPQELFNEPCNKFVAGFLGSPPMNFLDGDVISKNGVVCVEGDGFIVAVSDEKGKALNEQKSKQITIGVRPSDLTYSEEKQALSNFALRVVVSEYIGTQSVLLTKCFTQDVSVELKSDQILPKNKILNFTALADKVHLFDRVTEIAI